MFGIYNLFCIKVQFFGIIHICGLLVVVDVLDIPGQTEVGDLHHIIICDQHVPGCQVSVDTLHNKEGARQPAACISDAERPAAAESGIEADLL